MKKRKGEIPLFTKPSTNTVPGPAQLAGLFPYLSQGRGRAVRAGHPWRQGHVPAIRTPPLGLLRRPPETLARPHSFPLNPHRPPLLWLDFELASSRGHRCLAVVDASTGLSGVREHILEVRRAIPRPFRALERGGELRSRRSLRLLRPAVVVSPSPPPLRSTPTLPERANGLAVRNSSGSLLPPL